MHKLISTLTLCAALGVTHATAAEGRTSWEHDIVFNPSESVLAAERKGKVWVLSGMWDFEVRQAMREQFSRLEHFLFVNTKHVAPPGSGSEMWKDDDC